MTGQPPIPEDASLVALLRYARETYAVRIRTRLGEAGYDDLPDNALYVVGGLARERGGRALSQLIAELGVSKQAAGQLVDTLVIRGYLLREVDPADRRRLTVTLTERGKAAAKIIGAARTAVDNALLTRVGAVNIERTRRTLAALAEIGRE
ncbi:MAG TPA: MarR family transcriptional regulator [Gemmatimonadaceae bacterium]|jgi:DNA-binding MarR family transcriptional regulator